jgi:sulfite oxidase
VASMSGPTRRAVLLGAAALGFGGIAGALGRRALLPGPESLPGLIVRGLAPHNLETPRAALAAMLTPLELFFVRTHAHPPLIDPSAYRLTIDGLVERPSERSLAELRAVAAGSQLAVLQCSGNGRSYFRPRVPGVAWEAGAMGQARWSGPRLCELLGEAGLQDRARYLHLHGADTMALPATPTYVRTIPLERALEDDVLIGLDMNDRPLPWLHGGPARLVVPGWAGHHWVKWLTRIHVSDEEEPSFYAKTAYRLPGEPTAPGVTPKSTVPVTENGIKAVIARPLAGARVSAAGGLEVVGVAFSGRTHVVSVEVSGDGGGSWQLAALAGDETPGAWRVFRATVAIDGPGPRVIVARATDARGAVQPDEALWNPSGYLWNAVDRVACEVVA